MLRLSVCSCSFRFYPPVGVSPCLWCRTVLCCDVLFVCSWFRHCIDCRLLYICLGLLCLLCEAGPSLHCDCSLQGTCTVDWSYIAYCHSSTVSVMCYLIYVRTGLFLLCGGVFCTAVYCHCLSDPSFFEKGLRWS